MKAIFLDRDGVINIDTGYIGKYENFEFIPNVFNALKILANKNYLLFIVTNQSGIARGLFSLDDYMNLTKKMMQTLNDNKIIIHDVVFCPHHPDGIIKEYTKDCNCRKPKPGMINYLATKYNINLNESIMIGDKVTDIQCGVNAGIKKNFLITKKKINPDSVHINKIYNSLYSFARKEKSI